MPAGRVFDWHTHHDHQLAWAASGVLTVRTAEAAWVLPPTRALWIPAGVRHETLSAGTATMRTLYLRPDLCPIAWPECTPVAAGPLLAELIGYLGDPGLDPDQRARAEAVLVDLLQPVAMTAITVRLPAEERARQVAQALTDNPADGRTLEQWAIRSGPAGAPWPAFHRWHGAPVRPVAGATPASRSPARRGTWATSRPARSWPRSAGRPGGPRPRTSTRRRSRPDPGSEQVPGR
jgi:AraC-like ligand binding domain